MQTKGRELVRGNVRAEIRRVRPLFNELCEQVLKLLLGLPHMSCLMQAGRVGIIAARAGQESIGM